MTDKVTFLGNTADEQFKTWQKNNLAAFYLNIRGKKALRHKASCWHLGDAEGMNSAKNAKVCSNNSNELKDWAEANNLDFQICPDCIK